MYEPLDLIVIDESCAPSYYPIRGVFESCAGRQPSAECSNELLMGLMVRYDGVTHEEVHAAFQERGLRIIDSAPGDYILVEQDDARVGRIVHDAMRELNKGPQHGTYRVSSLAVQRLTASAAICEELIGALQDIGYSVHVLND